jgi:hypothetical protein
MPITLNNSNISIQYNTGSNYIIETVKSDLHIKDLRSGISSNLTSEPTISPSINNNNIAIFRHTAETQKQTTHNIYFPVNTVCDILLVGGGGSGGSSVGGGGGAGGVVYHKNITLNGKYTINVGAGGRSTTTSTIYENADISGVNNGNSSSLILNNSIIYEAKGGGSGGTRIGDPPNTIDGWNNVDGGFNGGSGGGGSCTGGGQIAVGGIKTQGNTYYNGTTYVSGGNNGANSIATWMGGGGGGAGSAGSGMNGGSGIINNITGIDLLYAAGGGGGRLGTDLAGIGGSGIGGNGSRSSGASAATIALVLDGKDGTGSGGGGGGYDYGWLSGPNADGGGKGGSGIVIIKIINSDIYKYIFFNYFTLPIDSSDLIAWYKLDGNGIDSTNITGTLIGLNGGLTYGKSTDININLPYSHWANATGTANKNWAISPNVDKNVPLTFTFWFRVSNTSYYTIMSYGNKEINSGSIQFDINNQILTIYCALNNQWTVSATYNGISSNIWYFVSFVLTNENPVKTYLYVNGILRHSGQGNSGQTLLYNNRLRLTIANSADGIRGFNGAISDIRIYKKALILSEITTLYEGYILSNTYTLTFNVPTLVNITNNTDINIPRDNNILQGSYTLNVGYSSSSISPILANQNIPKPNIFNSSSISINYHLLNPIKTIEGAQWTYNSSNINVYHLGNVGIGTTSPEYSLDVRGFINTSIGGYTQTGSENWIVLSDRRIKENIVKASYDTCLENVKNIELYSFNFKDNCINTNDRNQLGFIAQEVQKIYPKAVEVNKIILNNNEEINDLLTLNTTQIKYTLYGAVKNLIEKVENIESRVDNLYNIVITSSSNIDILNNPSNLDSMIDPFNISI